MSTLNTCQNSKQCTDMSNNSVTVPYPHLVWCVAAPFSSLIVDCIGRRTLRLIKSKLSRHTHSAHGYATLIAALIEPPIIIQPRRI